MIELEKDRAVHIRQDSVLLPLDQYDSLRALRTRAEEKLAQLEAEKAGREPDGSFHVRDAELNQSIKVLNWLLGRGI
jgi:hypothetical protein